MPHTLLIVHVHVHVKPEAVEAFKAASLANAASSRQEPGVVRFDVVQERQDLTRFVLIEIYRGDEAAAAHKLTPHYEKWRDTVNEMTAEPRRSVKYVNVTPDDGGW
jgi:autoinducer 2-degrading protein